MSSYVNNKLAKKRIPLKDIEIILGNIVDMLKRIILFWMRVMSNTDTIYWLFESSAHTTIELLTFNSIKIRSVFDRQRRVLSKLKVRTYSYDI